MSRSLVEDYLTATTVQIPRLETALMRFRVSSIVDSTLIRTQKKQIGALRSQLDSMERIVGAERKKAAEFERLYTFAENAYRSERRLRRMTLIGSGAAIAGVVLAVLVFQ